MRELVDSFQNQGNDSDMMDQLNKTINGYKNRMAEIEADLVSYGSIDNDKSQSHSETLVIKE